MTFTNAQIIGALASFVFTVTTFFGGYFLKDLRDGVHDLRSDVKADHEVLFDLVAKDKYLNGPVKAAPVASVKPLTPEVAMAVKKD